MVSIHIRDKVAMRYATATGDTDNFSEFVNGLVDAAVKQVEEEGKGEWKERMRKIKRMREEGKDGF